MRGGGSIPPEGEHVQRPRGTRKERKGSQSVCSEGA